MSNKLEFVSVDDDPFIVDVECICELCGNVVTTWQFLEDELLPISMFCKNCNKNTACHSRYLK